MPDNSSAEIPNLIGMVTSELVLDHMKAMDACQKAYFVALFSRKIRYELSKEYLTLDKKCITKEIDYGIKSSFIQR